MQACLCSRYSLSSDGLAPKFVCTYRLKCESDEKPNTSGSKIQRKEPQPGCLNMFMNVIWFFVGGILIWLTHIFYGLIFCITIIGIPFGKMHFRLARLALSPFGKEVV